MTNPDIRTAFEIVRKHLPPERARLWLFGSRARGGAKRWSDIDMAVEPLAPLSPGELSAIREALEESNILLEVDLVDITRAAPELRASIMKEGREWTV